MWSGRWMIVSNEEPSSWHSICIFNFLNTFYCNYRVQSLTKLYWQTFCVWCLALISFHLSSSFPLFVSVYQHVKTNSKICFSSGNDSWDFLNIVRFSIKPLFFPSLKYNPKYNSLKILFYSCLIMYRKLVRLNIFLWDTR